MSILQWLARALLRSLGLLGLDLSALLSPSSSSAALEDQRVRVTFRTNDGRSVALPLDRRWDVARVRRELAAALFPDRGGDGRAIRVIFAGHALADDVRVGDCDLGQGTVLHAVLSVHVGKDEAQKKEPVANQSQSADRGANRRPHFFVYCGARCRAMRPAKLRVRCARCREGAIELLGEPGEWEDVLAPDRIRGECQSDGCREATSAEFFFKCAAHDGDEELPPLSLVRPNADGARTCLACLDGERDPLVVFRCVDGHAVCIDCFAAYCTSRLNERAFVLDTSLGYTLGCPAGCGDSLVPQPAYFKMALSEGDYRRFQRFATEESVLAAGGVLCPQPGCGMGILPPEDEAEASDGASRRTGDPRRVVCEAGCGYVFCRDCLQGSHLGRCDGAASTPSTPQPAGLTSDPSSRWRREGALLSAALAADPSALAIRLTTKPCPKCRAPTERSGGCMHMVCTKSACGYNWCWVCQGEWTRECMAAHWFG